jgi:DNA-binding transcriptional LysR family regulator
MNLSDLRIFLAVASHGSVVAAAEQLHLTPSAVSKAVRRLETSLETGLFDRSSRQLALNPGGIRLVERARELLAMAERARLDIQGKDAAPECRLVGPAVLLWRDGPRIAGLLAGYANASLHANAMFEDDALAALGRGEASAAVVTGAVLDGKGRTWSADWGKVALGPLVLNLVAGSRHPLAARAREDSVAECTASVAEVLAHPFACPVRSLFCGEQRGKHADGWRDDVYPRSIRYWTDDLQLLLAFVRSGDALAYLPEFALAEPGLVRIHVSDCSFGCAEDAWFVWNRRTAPAWLAAVADAVQPVRTHAA